MKKEKMNKTDVALIVLSIAVFSFVVATMIIYTCRGWKFDTLITCFLGAGGIETIGTAAIQIAKYFKNKGGEDHGVVDE